MNSTALATIDRSTLAEQVAVYGDLSKLTPDQRMAYYSEVCGSMGLNPLTRPFDYLNLNGKMVLYAKREATDQLRSIHGVDIFQIDKSKDGDLFTVTAYARDKTGRQDADMGVVNIGRLQGESLANAMMKCITKAKRRVTLSICGLGWLDETEIETIPNARRVVVNDAGDIVAVEQTKEEREKADYDEKVRRAEEREIEQREAERRSRQETEPQPPSTKPKKAFSVTAWLDWFREAKQDDTPATTESIDAACEAWDKAVDRDGAAAEVVYWATDGQGFEDLGNHATSVLMKTATHPQFSADQRTQIMESAAIYAEQVLLGTEPEPF